MTIVPLLSFLLFGLTAAVGAGPRSAPRAKSVRSPDYAARVADLERAWRANPRDAKVLESLAGSYAMAGRHHEAATVLRSLLELTGSEEVRLRLGRNLMWAGETSAAISIYERYLKSRPQDRHAIIELIRLKRWRGDYSDAEDLCNTLLGRDPYDPVVLALKAEVLHWAGNRFREARRSAEAAARLDPDLPDARVASIYALRDQGQVRAAEREFQILSEQVSRRGGVTADDTYGDAYLLLKEEFARSGHVQQPAASVYQDSDGIHNVYTGLQVIAPVAEHKLRLDLGQWRTSAPLGGIFSAGRERSLVSEFRAGATVQLAPSVSLTAYGGASRRSAGTGMRPTFDVQLSASPADRWTVEFAAGREFLKVTPRAVDRDISSYRFGGGVQRHLDSRTSLAGRLDRRFWSDGNRSWASEASFRRILHYFRPFMADGGAQTRWEGYRRDNRFESGFFTPERYLRHDGFLGIHGELGTRLRYEVRGAAGAQQLARGADYRFSWEISSSASVRLAGALELYGSYQRRNYSLISRNGWYHGFFVALGIRP
jgi:tetratricopeptide (TPR) repeat protein